MKSSDDRVIQEIIAYISAHLDGDLTIATLARRFGLNAPTLRRRFQKAEGITLGAYVNHRRVEQAAGELLSGSSVTDASLGCSFETMSGFYKAFKRRYGVSPQQYKVAHGLPATPPRLPRLR